MRVRDRDLLVRDSNIAVRDSDIAVRDTKRAVRDSNIAVRAKNRSSGTSGEVPAAPGGGTRVRIGVFSDPDALSRRTIVSRLARARAPRDTPRSRRAGRT
jgi:hypothetical protein